MELMKKEIRCNYIGRKASDQFYVDDDVNVPDVKSDIARVILSDGKIKVEDIRMAENYARVTGKILYQILYATDESESRLASLQGKIPFEEMVYMEEEPRGQVMVKSSCVDISVSLIHSRKLNIKAMIEMELGADWEQDELVTMDVESHQKLYKKYEMKNLLTLQTTRKDTYRIKEEVKLAGTRENIGNILWTKVSLRKLDTRLGKDEIQIRGEVQMFCLYESPEGKSDWIEQMVPYEGRMECYGADDSMYHHLQAELTDENIDVRMDEDGEMRILGIEATLELKVTVYDEENLQILNDVYSLQSECQMQTESKIFESLVMQNHSKCKMIEELSLPEIKDSILQICHTGGYLQVEHTERVADGIMVEGMLHMFFLYIKADDEVPFDVWQGMIPFTHVIEAKGITADMHYDISNELEQLTVSLMGNDAVEVKAVLAFRVFLRKEEVLNNIRDISVEPMDMERAEKAPGIVGYVVKNGDELWSLAKRYRTTADGIKAVNGLTDDTLKPGDKILIFKENMSIL